MSNITINIEFLAGTEFKDSVAEAKALASKLNVAYVGYSFNGISESIGRHANIDSAFSDFKNKKDFICHS